MPSNTFKTHFCSTNKSRPAYLQSYTFHNPSPEMRRFGVLVLVLLCFLFQSRLRSGGVGGASTAVACVSPVRVFPLIPLRCYAFARLLLSYNMSEQMIEGPSHQRRAECRKLSELRPTRGRARHLSLRTRNMTSKAFVRANRRPSLYVSQAVLTADHTRQKSSLMTNRKFLTWGGQSDRYTI